jgi:Cysteine rich repeat
MRIRPRLVGVFLLLMAPAGAMAQGTALRQACGAEIQQHCAGVKPAEGRLRACVKEHFVAFSETCKQALLSSVAVVKACKDDVQKTCPGVQPGGGRIQACMKDHFTEYSERCQQAIVTAKFGAR